MAKALVIGNGESRRDIDLEEYRTEYIFVGCNAIHRDTTVDYLVCCDRRMVEEATKNPDTANTSIYVRPDWFNFFRKIQKRKNILTVPELPYQGNIKQDKPEHWGSGAYAVLVAANHFEEVTLLGFDLYPTNNKVNNIYKDTQNYSKSDAQSVDYSFWVYQIAMVFKHFPDTTFTILNTEDWVMPKEWQRPNVNFKILNQLTVDL